MRGLKVCLWIAGLACLSSVIGVFLPFSAWEAMVGFFGIGTLPASPLFFYTARLIAATYVGVGVFFIILALRPTSYGIMVPFSGVAAVILGLICAIVGFAVEMPNLWFLGDALGCTVVGIFILAFWRRTKAANRQAP